MHAWQEFLLFLFREGRVWHGRLSPSDWRFNFGGTSGQVDELGIRIVRHRDEAVSLFKSTRQLFMPGASKAFVLTPCKHEESSLLLLVPIILEGGEIPRLSLQLGVLRDPAQGPSFFGYRFESPESHDDHRFHHAQPLQGFGRGARVAGSFDSYPDRYPSFPLACRNAVELIASLLISVRDRRELRAYSTAPTPVPRGVMTIVQPFIAGIEAVPG
jgi:hypothetical protein